MENICLIIDFDGFALKDREFLTRELGYAAMDTDECGVVSFDLSGEPPLDESLNHHKSVWYCRNLVHGLPYYPVEGECPLPLHELDQFLLDLYRRHATEYKKLVAYKGGICERNKLGQLGIPHVNLEQYECPRYETLLRMGYDDVSCGLHEKPRKVKVFHCALAEVKAFRRWVCDKMKEEAAAVENFPWRCNV